MLRQCVKVKPSYEAKCPQNAHLREWETLRAMKTVMEKNCRKGKESYNYGL